MAKNSKVEQAAVVTTPAVATKADKARTIFKESYAQNPIPARKDILARCITEASLTPKGAATYLQNYKSKNGLVVSKKPVVA